MKLLDLEPSDLSLIYGTFLFQGLEEATVQAVLVEDCCTVEAFAKGQAIYTPTEFQRSLALLLSGTTDVRKGGLAVSTLTAGALFGAAALFTDQEEYETTVTAKNPTRVIFFPQTLVLDLLTQYPAIAQGYIFYLSERLHFLNRKLDGLLAPDTTEKLSHYLLAHSGPVECSATELARRLDVGRASLYRAFTTLEERGAIIRRGKQVQILDRTYLERRH